MKPKIPNGLTLESRRRWLKVTHNFRCLPSDYEWLELALRNWDLASESRAILKKEGMKYKDKAGNLKLHPQAIILKNAEHTFIKAWRCLGFREEPRKTGRPSQQRIYEGDDE